MMKLSLRIAVGLLGIAIPAASGMTELESLRARNADQARQIRRLEDENAKLKAGKSEPAAVVAEAKPAVDAGAAPKASLVADPGENPEGATDTVLAGDNLAKIARRNNCSATKLAAANGLEMSSIIRPGQKLKLPSRRSSTGDNTTTTTGSRNNTDPAGPERSGKTHKIQGDETYASIARKYRLPVDALIAANPEAKPTALRDGQIIRLPSGNNKPTPEPASSSASTQPPETSSKPAANKPADTETAVSAGATPDPDATAKANKKSHLVKIETEMTYGEFATKHDTTVTRLNELNGLDLVKSTILAKGSELYVPGQP